VAANTLLRKDGTKPKTETPANDATVPRDEQATRPRVVARNSDPAPQKKGPPLGEILVQRKTLTPDQLREAMERQHQSRKRLGEILMELGFADADAVLEGLSAQFGLPSTRVNSFTIAPEALPLLSERIARKYTAIPMLKTGTTLVVATANPRDLQALDDLRFAAGCEISTMIALESEIRLAHETLYGNPFAVDDAEAASVVVDLPGPQADLHDQAAQKSATSIVDRILARGATDRASDLHLEPTKNSLRVRFRIDGMLHEIADLLPALAPAVIARLKVLAGMDIAEHRNPQDGRFSATINSRSLDLRASTYPTIWGEKAVLRVLDRSGLQKSLSGIMNGTTLDAFRDLTRKPEGIVLVTGPTGSGKTSTLYAALGELAELGKNVTTIEDPVEYWLAGINQGQTNTKAGFTFASGLRAILRQDPDVIMVGEIRDPETLETAIEASLTGHLVLSTLHTNSSVATLTRLTEMGIEPYLLASSIRGILAQRLVRRTCESCRAPVPLTERQRSLFGDNPPETLYRGPGCAECRGIGYKGRVGVYELLALNSDLRRLMSSRASEEEILAVARVNGLTTLREQALELVRQGVTTIDEVTRVFHEL